MFKTAISAGARRTRLSGKMPIASVHKRNDEKAGHDEGESPEQPLDLSLHNQGQEPSRSLQSQPSASKIKSIIIAITVCLFLMLALDAFSANPRFRPHEFSQSFLLWVQDHPTQGIVAILIVIATAVVFMIPIGTPLTVGCGYIYKGAFGWKVGLTIATVVAMGGSALGAVVCFLLGRYLMREQVRQWVRQYPLFDAIDVAAAEHGLRIMAMLYLTPILPLGPVSYMCGTTSMALSSFVIAKIASLPLMLLYAFIGASTGALLGRGGGGGDSEFQKIEENQTLIVSGIALSFVMIGFITRNIKKELNKILERQKREKEGPVDAEQGVEIGESPVQKRRNL